MTLKRKQAIGYIRTSSATNVSGRARTATADNGSQSSGSPSARATTASKAFGGQALGCDGFDPNDPRRSCDGGLILARQ
jgi:hypothetical protein